MNSVNRRSFLKCSALGLSAFGGLLATSPGCSKAPARQSGTDDAWSLVILPDTQYYIQNYPGLLQLQIQWVIENRNKYNIVYVLQTGDMTNNNSPEQWQRAGSLFARFDGVVPYAIALGNHDTGPGGSSKDRSSLASEYFPVSRFKQMGTFGGTMESGKIDNMFHRFRAGGRDYLIFCFEWSPRDEALEWAGQIIAKHPDHQVFLMTHAYLYSDSTRYDWKSQGEKQDWSPHSYPTEQSGTTVNDGQEMWDKLVRKHPNILMTINGHVCHDGLGYLVSEGDAGNRVHQMLVNFQMKPVGGEGWLRIMTFRPREGTVEVKDYSPLFDTFKTEPDNNFAITL